MRELIKQLDRLSNDSKHLIELEKLIKTISGGSTSLNKDNVINNICFGQLDIDINIIDKVVKHDISIKILKILQDSLLEYFAECEKETKQRLQNLIKENIKIELTSN